MEHMMGEAHCWHMVIMCLLMTTFLVLGIASFIKYPNGLVSILPRKRSHVQTHKGEQQTVR